MQYNEILHSAETKEEELERFVRFIHSNLHRMECFKEVCS